MEWNLISSKIQKFYFKIKKGTNGSSWKYTQVPHPGYLDYKFSNYTQVPCHSFLDYMFWSYTQVPYPDYLV